MATWVKGKNGGLQNKTTTHNEEEGLRQKKKFKIKKNKERKKKKDWGKGKKVGKTPQRQYRKT